jgi:hypothetical protein
MKKLMLHLEDLKVDTFETSGAVVRRGTVRGHGWSQITQCVTDEYYSCPDSCGVDSCNPDFCGPEPGETNGCPGGTGVNCPSWEGSCELTAPDPVGTCCYRQC